MYESFYGLRIHPFSLVPDPAFLYLGRKHKVALSLLEYGLLNRSTFTVITGQSYWDLDHREGFHIYPAMAQLDPHFIVPTGDTVYMDSEAPRATTVELARYHWNRMYGFPRHIEFNVTEQLKKVVDELERLVVARPFKLVLGGTDEIVNEVGAMLPEPVARRLIGNFTVDYKQDTEQQIFERAELVWRNREQFEESNLLDLVVEAAKSGGRGVLGIEPTLSALVEEKVRMLLIASGLAISGSVCTRCDYLAEGTFKSCPVCGGDAEQRDVTDRAVEKAILTGAEAEVVFSDPARDRLLAEGGLGARLRY